MQVVLLERIEKLGKLGDVVRVKDGFARNFLLPKKKALRATKANIERFERDRVELESKSADRRVAAEAIGGKLAGQSFVIIRQAGESGQLYGSVNARNIIDAVNQGGFSFARSEVILPQPIKTLGLHKAGIGLHPEVKVDIIINVARSAEEAVRQARGETISAEREEAEIAFEALLEDDETAAKLREDAAAAPDEGSETPA